MGKIEFIENDHILADPRLVKEADRIKKKYKVPTRIKVTDRALEVGLPIVEGELKGKK
jgi:hypothetical protein